MSRAMNNIKRAVTIALTSVAILLPGGCSVVGTDPSTVPVPSPGTGSSGGGGTGIPDYTNVDDGTRLPDGTVLIKGMEGIPLSTAHWNILLNKIDSLSSLVTLDLSECMVDADGGQTVNAALNMSSVASTSVLFKWRQLFPPFSGYSGQKLADEVYNDWVVFDPRRGTPHNGKSKIAHLILPDEATLIPSGDGVIDRESKDKGDLYYGMWKVITITNPTFADFTALKSVAGRNVQQIGRYAFARLKALERVVFPEVSHQIGPWELATTAYWINREPNSKAFPPDDEIIGRERKDIDYAAFYECTALKEVAIPNAMNISMAAFQGCTSLRNIYFPTAWNISNHAFEGCTGLTDVTLHAATKISNYAFRNCTNLTRVSFPVSLPVDSRDKDNLPPLPRGTCGDAGDGVGGKSDKTMPPTPYDGDKFWDNAYKYSIVIFDGAFSGCRNLRTVEIRHAWNVKFGSHAFANTTKTLDIWLSDSKHSLNDGLSFGLDLNNPLFQINITSITVETINFHGLSQANFDIIRSGKNPDGSDAGYGGGLNDLIPRLDPSKPRITLVRK